MIDNGNAENAKDAENTSSALSAPSALKPLSGAGRWGPASEAGGAG